MLELIDDIIEEAQIKYRFSDSTITLLTCSQSEVTICNEVIQICRAAKGLTQEELSNDICSTETLSRIENGRQSPRTKKYYQLLDKLEVDKDFFGGYIISDEYEAYQLYRPI